MSISTNNCLKIYRVGTKIKIGKNIEATINGAAIYGGNRVQYQVVYWDGNDRKCEWIEGFEVDGPYEELRQIGFLNE